MWLEVLSFFIVIMMRVGCVTIQVGPGLEVGEPGPVRSGVRTELG
jgi:hypothetical protein